jgi:hypothetical protein
MKSMADIIDRTNSLCDASAWIRRITSKRVCKKGRGRRAGGETRFHGLLAFAESFGVTPQHAHMVLAGKRESRRLLDAWKQRAS